MEQKKRNTIKQYLHDIVALVCYAEGRELTKSLVPDCKNSLAETCELSSANSMIALLKQYGTLPAIKTKTIGNIVEIKVGYRLPPSEEEFYKLYSWPVTYDFSSNFPQVFTRKMAKQVFPMFKHTLETHGYCFVEE